MLLLTLELSTLEISRKALAMLTGLPTYFDKRPQPSGNLFNLVDTVLKVGIEKAKKDVEEEGVEIIENFLVEKESVILRLSDFAEQVVLLRLFKCIHTVFLSHIPGRTAPIDFSSST